MLTSQALLSPPCMLDSAEWEGDEADVGWEGTENKEPLLRS